MAEKQQNRKEAETTAAVESAPKRIHLDARDRRILYELDMHGRATRARIGKLVGLSSDVVHYRVNRMEQQGVIEGYYVMTDLGKLGLWQMKICLQLRRYNKKLEEELLDFLETKPYVRRVASCRGAFDLMFTIGSSDLRQLNACKEELYLKLDQYISRETMSLILEIHGYRRCYLHGEKVSTEDYIPVLDVIEKRSLDQTDWKILAELSKDGKASIVDIAHRIRSTEKTVAQRIRKMEKDKVILGCRVALNTQLLGIAVYKMFIHTHNITRKRELEFYEFCRRNPNITHLSKVLGVWDYEVEFEFFDAESFYRLVSDMRDSFSDIIKQIETVRIVKQHQSSFY
jgi:DNA-binding Lrp family transcriptional regulator